MLGELADPESAARQGVDHREIAARAARFTPDLRVHVHHGADRLDGDSLAAALADVDLVITSYGVATRDQAALSTPAGQGIGV